MPNCRALLGFTILMALIVAFVGLSARPADAALVNTEVENNLNKFFAKVYGGQTVEARMAAGQEAEKYLLSVKDRFKRHPVMHEFYMGQVKMYQGLAAVNVWEEDPAKTAYRDKGRRLYEQSISTFESVVQKVVEKMEVYEGGGKVSRRKRTSRAPRKTKKRMPAIYNEYANVLSQINYYMGWTYYRKARTLTNATQKKNALETSLDYFRLQVGDKITGEFNLVKNPLAADCFVGQGLVLVEQGKQKDVIALFDGLTHKKVSREIWPQILLLKVESFMSQGQYKKVLNEANTVAVNAIKLPQPTVVELQIQLSLLTAYAMGSHREAGKREDYSRKAAQLATSLVSRGEPWRSETIKALGKLEGKASEPIKAVLELESLFGAGKYPLAAQKAEAALKTLNIKTHGELTIRARFIAGASLITTGKTEQGLAHLNWILKNAPKHELASDAAATCISAQWQKVQDDPSDENVKVFFAQLDMLRQSFPNHEIMKRAAWFEGATLINQDKLEEGIKKLSAIKLTDVDYASAKLMIANGAITIARTTKSAVAAQNLLDTAGDNLKALEKFMANPGEAAEFLDMNALRDITAGAIVALAEAYLRPPVLNAAKAVAALSNFEKRFPAVKGLEGTIRTIKSEALLATGKIEDAVKTMRALLSDKKTAAEGMGIVILLANRMEENITSLREAGKEKEAEANAESLAKVYDSLGQHFAETGRADSPDARTVRLRKARAFELARKYDKAQAVYEDTLKALSSIKDEEEKRSLELLVRRGMALMDEARGSEALKKGNSNTAAPLFDKAREHWRYLGGVFKARTNEWFEARYHLTLMHYKIGKIKGDLKGAFKVIRYFELTNPTLGGSDWKPRFLDLKGKITKAMESTK